MLFCKSVTGTRFKVPFKSVCNSAIKKSTIPDNFVRKLGLVRLRPASVMFSQSVLQIGSCAYISGFVLGTFENVNVIHFLILPHFAKATRGPPLLLRIAVPVVRAPRSTNPPFGRIVRSGGDGRS